MYSKSWQIIKDDSKRTFEICGQAVNSNSSTNNIHGMQRAGMNVSYVLLPITNRTSNKEFVKITSYTKEDGLQERLQKEYREIIARSVDEW